MNAIVLDELDVLGAQRRLRRNLLERSATDGWSPARDLAAHLILYLDEAPTGWALVADWLRRTLDADRVDGGLGGFVAQGGQERAYVVSVEARRPTLVVPTALGARFDAADPGLRAVWNAEFVTIPDVRQARDLGAHLRQALLARGTGAKIALHLRDDSQQPLGLMCADWLTPHPDWRPERCRQVSAAVRDLIGPVLGEAQRLRAEAVERAEAVTVCRPGVAALSALTPAELRVARLVARGLRYKEVACHLNRSHSTIDHLLRSIRAKLGVRSTRRLMHLLQELPDRP